MSKVVKMGKPKEVKWKDMSRQQKRRQTFYINKRPYTVFDVIKIAVRDLPLMVNKDGKRMDHYNNMLLLYMDGGMDEVLKYNKTIFDFQDKLERKIKRKRLWQKMLGFVKVFKGSQTSSEGKPESPSVKEKKEQVAS